MQLLYIFKINYPYYVKFNEDFEFDDRFWYNMAYFRVLSNKNNIFGILSQSAIEQYPYFIIFNTFSI